MYLSWEMEGKILTLENEIEHLHTLLQDPVFVGEGDQLTTTCELMDLKQKTLDQLYHRWQELEAMQ